MTCKTSRLGSDMNKDVATTKKALNSKSSTYLNGIRIKSVNNLKQTWMWLILNKRYFEGWNCSYYQAVTYIGTYAADGDKIWTVCSLLCVNLYEALQMLGMSRVRMSIAPIEMNHILWIWETSLTYEKWIWVNRLWNVSELILQFIYVYLSTYWFHVVFVYI